MRRERDAGAELRRYTYRMPSGIAVAPIDVAAVQAALAADGIDGWLLYDFRGLNPIAAELTAVARQEGHLATRRWFYLIPATGEPRGLVHAIERHSLAHLPGTTERYAGREQLDDGLRTLVSGLRRVAMEYSPNCAIPYISRVDAGTIELIRQTGVEVVSSGDLVQRFAAVWDDRAIETHRAGVREAVPDQGPGVRRNPAAARRAASRRPNTTFKQQMVGWFRDEGLVSDSAPNVSAAENAGNPHYLPTPTRPSGDPAGRAGPARPLGQARSSWRGLCGHHLDGVHRGARARPAGQGLRGGRARRAMPPWRSCSGRWRPVRSCAAGRSIAPPRRFCGAPATEITILHRTGHSLGEDVHGNGVNMDDYETHDDRRLLPGTGFTIEPGVYFDDFGVRCEINMIVGAREAAVTGTAAGRDRSHWCRRISMSTRKTTFFYVLLTSVASFAVALVIASRLELTPVSSAQTHRGADDEQRADRRTDRRADLPQHREGAVADGRQHPHRDEAPRRRTCIGLLRRRRRRAGRLPPPVLRPRRRARTISTEDNGRGNRRRQAPREQKTQPPAPASSSAPRTASSSPTTTWSTTPPRSKCSSSATKTTTPTPPR